MSSPAARTTHAATDFQLQRIGQIAVVVQDVARATRFYTETLGMPLLLEVPGRLAFVDCGGVRLMLSPPEGGGSAVASPIIYYAVPDIQATYDTLAARGVESVQGPHLVGAIGDRDVWIAFVRDSEGNLLGLTSEVPRAPAGG
jgi:methylmalonyl-CoA/ethylmalonyl-CoA epimerase